MTQVLVPAGSWTEVAAASLRGIVRITNQGVALRIKQQASQPSTATEGEFLEGKAHRELPGGMSIWCRPINFSDGVVDTAETGTAISDDNLVNVIVNSEIGDGEVSRSNLEADIIDDTKIEDDAVGTEHIQPGAVGNTEMADMAQNTVKGRITASTGAPEDLTGANLRTIIGTASDTAEGVVELSSDAEAIAKTATNRALTPANLTALAASDTLAGLAEIATEAELLAGTDTARFPTPALLSPHLPFLIDEQDASSSANIDIDLDGSVYYKFEIELIGVKPASGDKFLTVQLSTSGVFNTGASDYAQVVDYGNATGAATIFASTGAVISLTTTAAGRKVGTNGVFGDITVLGLGNSSDQTHVRSRFSYQDDTGGPAVTNEGGYRRTAETNDGIRIAFTGANIASGKFVTRGWKLS